MVKRFSIFVVNFLLIFLITSLKANPNKLMNATAIQLALKKLNVLGSVLFIAAHPDDENTALLAYLAKEKLVRTAYLAVTRGGGGQNLIGPEKSELMSVLRTQELLAARRIDGAEQFFTRAIDFGYSKSSQETLEIWDHDLVLSDMVWIIRKFQPDVIISRFPSSGGGHGHHTASGILAEEAFLAAGNPNKYPEQLKHVEPWQAKRLLWNTWRGQSGKVKADLGTYNPFLGESYTEIAAKSRSMHKSQGFGSGSRRGSSMNYFELITGEPATRDLFDNIDLSWNRVPNGKGIGDVLKNALLDFKPENPSFIIPTLLNALNKMNSLSQHFWIELKKKELLGIIKACSGLWLEANTTDYSASPGQKITIELSAINRSNISIKLEGIRLPFTKEELPFNLALNNNQPISREISLVLPKSIGFTHPFWLESEPLKGSFVIKDQNLIGLPEKPSEMNVEFTLKIDGEPLTYTIPVMYRWVDPVEGENSRKFEISPRVTINFTEKVFIFPNEKSKEISLMLKNGSVPSSGNLRLQVPEGWRTEPKNLPFSLNNKHEEKLFNFQVYPNKKIEIAQIKAIAEIDGQKISNGFIEIDYSHIPVQTLYPPAEAKLVRHDILTDGKNIGYIMGSGDDVPNSLQQIGYDVALLSENDLSNNNLSKFDAIITGVRVYNTQPWINNLQTKLLEYVYSGGTLLVQYNVSRRLVTNNIGPYPFTISGDRVTVEEAELTFLQPNHPLLNWPNKITQTDFNDWIQERGLYFAGEWDSRYIPIISCHDPNESGKEGGLIFAQYGKGVFIYTGYSWFRQLPEGVPGAYRLFANLIAAGKK